MALPYSMSKVYGPYKRKDGRLHIIAICGSIKKTISYPKYLMEIHMGRYLANNETVDHIDHDFSNNKLSNLRVIDRVKHCRQDTLRLSPAVIKCQVCQSVFTLKGGQLHDAFINKDMGCVGPFCSKRCAGIASHSTSDYTNLLGTKEHYTLKSLNY